MPTASAAVILRDVRQCLEVAQATAAVTAAGLRSEVDCDAEAATTLQRCVCDPIVEQMGWLSIGSRSTAIRSLAHSWTASV
jgi:hypothetical protein